MRDRTGLYIAALVILCLYGYFSLFRSTMDRDKILREIRAGNEGTATTVRSETRRIKEAIDSLIEDQGPSRRASSGIDEAVLAKAVLNAKEEERRLWQAEMQSLEDKFSQQEAKLRGLAHSQTSQTTQTTKTTSTTSTPNNKKLTLRVFIFTYQRVAGLQRIFRSLAETNYFGHTVHCTIFIDNKKKTPDKPGSVDHQAPPEEGPTLNWIKDHAKWPHGELRVHKREKNAGLKRSIMEAWYPMADNEFGAFFEDDIEVSKYWYKWVLGALDKYYFVPDRHPRLIGLSLYRPIHDEITEKDFYIDNSFRPFLLQQPCSWGAVYFPGPWREFRDWFPTYLDDPKLPFFSPSNLWFWYDSWKKFLIKHMWDYGLFMVYPNLPEQTVLSTNHLMKGMHNLPPRDKFELPLFTEEHMERFTDALQCPPLQKLNVYDMKASKVPNYDSLPGAATPYKTDKLPTN